MTGQNRISVKVEIPSGGKPLTAEEKAKIHAELQCTEIAKIIQGKAGESKALGKVEYEMELIDEAAL